MKFRSNSEQNHVVSNLIELFNSEGKKKKSISKTKNQSKQDNNSFFSIILLDTNGNKIKLRIWKIILPDLVMEVLNWPDRLSPKKKHWQKWSQVAWQKKSLLTKAKRFTFILVEQFHHQLLWCRYVKAYLIFNCKKILW